MKSFVKKILRRIGLFSFAHAVFYENRFALQVLRCAWRYRRLSRAAKKKPKDCKIRVLFIVSEIAKWKEQFLYEAMERSGEFYPIVGLSSWNVQHELFMSVEDYERVQACAAQFFSKMGDRFVRTVTVENGKRVYHDLSEFDPDIVFYTEQWCPCKKQYPIDVSKFAFTYFLPYYVPDFGIPRIDCHQTIHQMLTGYFCLGESWAKLYRRSLMFTAHTTRFVSTGHPALDYFYHHRDRMPTGNCVIYAPHFSFAYNRAHDYKIGTFDWNGREILAYAEAHSEINWVFKPHPNLRRTLKMTRFMDDAEIEAYYLRWAKIGRVSTTSDYQELFMESHVMITDSGSFLPEYGSTGRPVIRLICSESDIKPPRAAQSVYDTYYQVRNLDELHKALKLVVEDGQDPMREVRLSAVRSAGLIDKDASQNIIRHLLGKFGRCS